MTIEQMREKVSTFISRVENRDIEYQGSIVELIGLLPLKRENIDSDLKMVNSYYHVNIKDYKAFLRMVYDKSEYDYTKVFKFLDDNDITFNSIKTNWKFGNNISRIPMDERGTFVSLYMLYDDSSSEYRSEVIGKAAEYLVNDYLNTYYDATAWVSHKLGDGFGYDFIAKNGNDYDVIEVKSSTRDQLEIKLSDNEAKVYRKIDRNNLRETYHVYVVKFNKIGDKIYFDIIDSYLDNKEHKMDMLVTNQYLDSNIDFTKCNKNNKYEIDNDDPRIYHYVVLNKID